MSLDGDRSADIALGVLRKVLNFARDDGLISLNPASGHRLRYSANRSEIIWSPDKLELICSVSSQELARVILLSAYSGLARTDLCKLTWSKVSENAIQFSRSKTGELATVPIFREIRAVLESTPKICPHDARCPFLKCAVFDVYAPTGSTDSRPYRPAEQPLRQTTEFPARAAFTEASAPV